MPIDAPTWRAMSATHKDDVWEYVQRYSDINKRSKSHHKYFHCAGTKSFADINEEETKLQEVKITQPSSSSSSSIATADDIYSQVFGKDRLVQFKKDEVIFVGPQALDLRWPFGEMDVLNENADSVETKSL
ncbi:hypothetical protein Taro_048977, partial [Colocasia esculenta]|nr:hypothetical protein [Colocasia esculenta]